MWFTTFRNHILFALVGHVIFAKIFSLVAPKVRGCECSRDTPGFWINTRAGSWCFLCKYVFHTYLHVLKCEERYYSKCKAAFCWCEQKALKWLIKCSFIPFLFNEMFFCSRTKMFLVAFIWTSRPDRVTQHSMSCFLWYQVPICCVSAVNIWTYLKQFIMF